MSEYRSTARSRSDALIALAERAQRGDHEIATHGHTLPAREAERRLRLAAALNERDVHLSVALGILILSLIALGSSLLRDAPTTDRLGIAFIGCGLFAISMWIVRRAGRHQQRAVATELAWPDAQPFPIDGYADWLVADRPILQVTLRTGIDPNLLRQGMLIIDPHARIEVVDDSRYRLAMARSWAPQPQADKRGISNEPSLPTVRSNIVTLRALTKQVLIPLHRDVGIVEVRMGEHVTLGDPP